MKHCKVEHEHGRFDEVDPAVYPDPPATTPKPRGTDLTQRALKDENNQAKLCSAKMVKLMVTNMKRAGFPADSDSFHALRFDILVDGKLTSEHWFIGLKFKRSLFCLAAIETDTTWNGKAILAWHKPFTVLPLLAVLYRAHQRITSIDDDNSALQVGDMLVYVVQVHWLLRPTGRCAVIDATDVLSVGVCTCGKKGPTRSTG